MSDVPNASGLNATPRQDGDGAAPHGDPTDERSAAVDDDIAPDGAPDGAESPDTLAELAADAATPAFIGLLEYLHRVRGFDFRGYKRASLARRFRRRMQALHIPSFEAYRQYLEQHEDEFAELFNTVLINVTAFFRDDTPWKVVAETVIPMLIAKRAPTAPLRIWSAGSATGEEAYTLAMLFAEALGIDQFRARVKIYATDVDEDALQRARAAVYSARDVQAVPPELRARYFEPLDDRFIFRKDLRRAVIFGRNDLIQDAPISRVDVLVSRNTLMYFDAPTQRHILTRFHFALNDGGFLMLGRAETLLTHANTFTPLDLKNRIFVKVPRHASDRSVRMVRTTDDDAPTGPSANERLRDGAFETAPVAQIVVNQTGTITFLNARARTLFHLGSADIGRPLQDLEMSYRPTELRSLVDQAYVERQPVVRTDISWTTGSGDTRWFTLHVVPVPDGPSSVAGVTLSFVDITNIKQLQQDLETTNHELETAFEELQSTNEELETTNEELQSTVEELETTNEELQSTNEELETMNEELQSINEELHAINDELRQRSDDLNDANAFLDSVFTSMRGGVVVLDQKMHILVWNDRAEELWGIRRAEALGQSFLALDIGLPVDALKPAIRSVLLGAVSTVEQTLDAVNRRGRTIECTVNIDVLHGPDGPDGPDGQARIRGAILVMRETAAEPVGD